jgi:hypothetical protein
MDNGAVAPVSLPWPENAMARLLLCSTPNSNPGDKNSSTNCTIPGQELSHPVLEGKPNADHVRGRISYSRTQQLHNMDIIT